MRAGLCGVRRMGPGLCNSWFRRLFACGCASAINVRFSVTRDSHYRARTGPNCCGPSVRPRGWSGGSPESSKRNPRRRCPGSWPVSATSAGRGNPGPAPGRRTSHASGAPPLGGGGAVRPGRGARPGRRRAAPARRCPGAQWTAGRRRRRAGIRPVRRGGPRARRTHARTGPVDPGARTAGAGGVPGRGRGVPAAGGHRRRLGGRRCGPHPGGGGGGFRAGDGRPLGRGGHGVRACRRLARRGAEPVLDRAHDV